MILRMENAELTRLMPKKGFSPDNSACKGFFGGLRIRCFIAGYGKMFQ
jgi:hypothetical protein